MHQVEPIHAYEFEEAVEQELKAATGKLAYSTLRETMWVQITPLLLMVELE